MEYRIVWGTGTIAGTTYWYNRKTGVIVQWEDYEKLSEEEKQDYVHAGVFKNREWLLIVHCAYHGEWHRIYEYPRYPYLTAVSFARDCIELKKWNNLQKLCTPLANAFIYSKINDKIFASKIKKWFYYHWKEGRGIMCRKTINEIFEVVPEYKHLKADVMKYVNAKLISREIKEGKV